MWNYQEILFSLRPALAIEFGTRFGGSALFFAAVMRQLGSRFRILSVDIDAATISEKTRQDPNVELLISSSVDPKVAQRVTALRKEYPGPVFAILDSDHSQAHVLGEMKLLRPVLTQGDYVVVEDSNVNGHPVYVFHGPGPFEAMEEYFREFPDDLCSRYGTGSEIRFYLRYSRVSHSPVNGAKAIIVFPPVFPRAFRTIWDRVAG